MSEPVVPELVFPIGQPHGVACVSAAGASPPEYAFQVRLGASSAALPDELFEVWALAHGPEPDYQYAWTRETFEAVAAVEEIDQLERKAGLLREAGLLRFVPVEPVAAASFAATVRVVAAAEGQGNSASNVGTFNVGSGEVILNQAPVLLFDCLAFGDLHDNLLDSVAHLHQRLELVTILTQQDVVPSMDDLLLEILTALPRLISSNTAFLDAATVPP